MTPELSICIPTFNRANYLEELLASLAPQLDSRVEVVVSDNASTDATPEIIKKWRRIMPQLRYRRLDRNHGADHNYLSVVEMATGRYCWLLGSDDIAAENAVAIIAAAIQDEPDCLLFARQLRTKDMALIEDQSFWSFKGTRLFDFSTEPFVRYLESATSICALFSYLSSIVFKRAIWVRDGMKKRLVGSAYAHADILIRQLSAGGTLLASDTVLVNCRCGNDSFSDGNKGKRLALDFDGYQQIAHQLSSRNERTAMMQILLREHPWRNLIHVMRHKASTGPRAQNEFIAVLSDLGVSTLVLQCYRVLATTPWFGLFVLIEPAFKRNSLFARMRRSFSRAVASSTTALQW